MAIILSIESSGTICSVALHQNGELLALVESNEPNIHGQSLAVFIKEITELQNIEINKLDAIAVSEGPGSYTGLRIGVSVAKGICYASKIPLIAVDTLKSLAFAMLQQNEILIPKNAVLMPMIDARRMEVYLAGYNLQLNKTLPTKPVILDEIFYTSLAQPSFVCGNGASKIEGGFFNNLLTLVPEITFSAKHLGELAFKKFENHQFEDVAYFEPVYLKEFAVVLKL
ncbi:MAG: tRNA (adenosine(37)-N6)-threonylcarbamoyltransferase complex dimerization subunit type 1 TsaB [Bacteroidia bacterium]